MRHLLLLLLACTALACSSSTDSEPGLPEPDSKNNFLPLAVGNTWTYERLVKVGADLQLKPDVEIRIDGRSERYLTYHESLNFINDDVVRNRGKKFVCYNLDDNVRHVDWGITNSDSQISDLPAAATIMNGNEVFGHPTMDSIFYRMMFPLPLSTYRLYDPEPFPSGTQRTYEWDKTSMAFVGDALYENCMKLIVRSTHTYYVAYREEWFWKLGLGIVQITLYKNDEIQEQWNLKNAVLK